MSVVKFNWDEKQEFELTGYEKTLPADALDRQKYAKFITNFLANEGYDSQSETKKNYVLNLNAEWGAGKTYFIKRLYQSLKENYPTVYIDAWKQDYSDDPLLTVVSSVVNQLREQAGKDADSSIYKLPRKMIGLLKSAAPALVGAMAKRYLGTDFSEVLNSDEDVTVNGEDAEGKSVDLGKAASEVVKKLFKEHEAKATAIASLKVNIKQWVEAVAGIQERKYPAYILIDELDRCRPSYAVEMLEVIKHIFDIEGVVFIIATDTHQLQHAVKNIYGSEFDASRYLARFFHSRFTLRQPELKKLLPTHCHFELLAPENLQNRNITLWPSNSIDNQISNLAMVFEAFQLPARTAIQVANRILSIVSNLANGQKLDITLLAALFAIREIDEQLYQDIVNTNQVSKLDGKAISNYLYENKSIDLSKFEIVYEFKGSTHSSQTGESYGIDRSIEQKTYQTTLQSQLNFIFAGIFNIQIPPTSYIQNSNNKYLSLLQKTANNVTNHKRESDSEALSLELLKYTFYDRELESLTANIYMDLVELAADLDSMENG